MIGAMKQGAGSLWIPRSLAVAAMAACALFSSAASAQDTPPEQERPNDFRAMETPGAPKNLTTTNPADALITPPTGPVNPPPGFTGSKMVMTQQVWQRYAAYLRNDVAIGYGLFMITVDGRAYYVKECKNYACQISPVTRNAALDECKAQLNNKRCVVFAEGRSIKYAYQVVPE